MSIFIIMKRILEYKITSEQAGSTIESYMRQKGYSRHIIAHLKRTENGICLNENWSYTNQRVAAGDLLTVTILEETSSPHIVPIPMSLSIKYEDDDILVLDKPADTPIHPSINNYDNTLANGLAWYFKEQGIPFVFRCINRLDRDTTGLLIIAKHMLSGAILSQMVVRREIRREYLAIAAGKIPDEGTITAPIARKEGSAIERCVNFDAGDHAVTHYWKKAFCGGCSLVRLKLETGRTHQIRVHMKYLGHPLIGDFLYYADSGLHDEMNISAKKMQRQALHSFRLEFLHPITGKRMSFVSPLPDDMNWIH